MQSGANEISDSGWFIAAPVLGVVAIFLAKWFRNTILPKPTSLPPATVEEVH
jgi:hypothetical protein